VLHCCNRNTPHWLTCWMLILKTQIVKNPGSAIN
jgi:hypothetical protein